MNNKSPIGNPGGTIHTGPSGSKKPYPPPINQRQYLANTRSPVGGREGFKFKPHNPSPLGNPGGTIHTGPRGPKKPKPPPINQRQYLGNTRTPVFGKRKGDAPPMQKGRLQDPKEIEKQSLAVLNEIKDDQVGIRKKKTHISSFNSESGDPWNFRISLVEFLRNVTLLRFISVSITYVVPALAQIPKFGAIYLENFPTNTNNQFELTASGERYHAIFPIVSGTSGSTKTFLYEFPPEYYTSIDNSGAKIEHLFVKVLKEDPVLDPGKLINFEDVTYIRFEFETSSGDNITG
ncbi:MAG: hypothetical protein N2B06_17195 [Clostridium sp.]